RFHGWKLLALVDHSRMLVPLHLHGGHLNQHRPLVARLGPACVGWRWQRHCRYKTPTPQTVGRDASRQQNLRHGPPRPSKGLWQPPAILLLFELMIHADPKIPDNLRCPSRQLHKPWRYVPELQDPVTPHPPKRLYPERYSQLNVRSLIEHRWRSGV